MIFDEGMNYKMPVTSVSDIWQLICEECKKIITQVAFDCFIANLNPISFNKGEMIIGTELHRNFRTKRKVGVWF